jgi:hypothetical protein
MLRDFPGAPEPNTWYAVALASAIAGHDLAPGTDVAEAADYLARMILTFIRGQGTWDLDDPVQVTALVRRHLLVGILADPATG